jgi:hypothetical protein
MGITLVRCDVRRNSRRQSRVDCHTCYKGQQSRAQFDGDTNGHAGAAVARLYLTPAAS